MGPDLVVPPFVSVSPSTVPSWVRPLSVILAESVLVSPWPMALAWLWTVPAALLFAEAEALPLPLDVGLAESHFAFPLV